MVGIKKLKLNRDERGSLVEVFKFPNDGQVMVVNIKPLTIRGDHYHKRKTEHFTVLRGSLILTTKDRATGVKHDYLLEGATPKVVSVPPNHTHRITADGDGASVLIWANEVYDEKDADTFPESV